MEAGDFYGSSGVMLESVTRYLTFPVANAFQALLFASLHEGLVLFPFYLALGLLAGLLAQRSGGLAAPILLHAVNNLLVFGGIARGLV